MSYQGSHTPKKPEQNMPPGSALAYVLRLIMIAFVLFVLAMIFVGTFNGSN